MNMKTVLLKKKTMTVETEKKSKIRKILRIKNGIQVSDSKTVMIPQTRGRPPKHKVNTACILNKNSSLKRKIWMFCLNCIEKMTG